MQDEDFTNPELVDEFLLQLNDQIVTTLREAATPQRLTDEKLRKSKKELSDILRNIKPAVLDAYVKGGYTLNNDRNIDFIFRVALLELLEEPDSAFKSPVIMNALENYFRFKIDPFWETNPYRTEEEILALHERVLNLSPDYATTAYIKMLKECRLDDLLISLTKQGAAFDSQMLLDQCGTMFLNLVDPKALPYNINISKEVDYSI